MSHQEVLSMQNNTLSYSFLVLSIFSSMVHAGIYGGGNGSQQDPFLIYSPDHMQQIGANPNDWWSHFKLMTDVDLSMYDGREGRPAFNRIGFYDADNLSNSMPFSGQFDGNGHVISNFSYNGNDDNVGLFNYVSFYPKEFPLVVKNLGLLNPQVDGGSGSYVGNLIGRQTHGAIGQCYVEGGSVSGNENVGGLVGSSNGIIAGCYSTSHVIGNSSVGGIVGSVSNPENDRYYFYLFHCYVAGLVEGSSGTGGLAGTLSEDVSDSQFIESFWDIEISRQFNGPGAGGKCTCQMKELDTFSDWGCDQAWTINEGVDYPRFIWQNQPGTIITTPAYGGGSGTELDPYQIFTADQFAMIGDTVCDWDKHFILMDSIDLSFYDGLEGRPRYVMIGDLSVAFTGVFDGNGYTILNFIYQSESSDNAVGLFAELSGATIRNLTLIDPDVGGTDALQTGGLVGSSSYSNIINCHIIGGKITGVDYVGGLVGNRNSGTVDRCSVDTLVESTGQYSGLLLGYSYHGLLKSSFSNGTLTGVLSTGGLIGAGTWFQITNCYSIADVVGQEETGGLVGSLKFENASIMNSYAAGNVSGQTKTGGLVGSCDTGIVSDCYWDIQLSGQTNNAGGGVGLNTDQMKNAETYLGWGCGAEWVIDHNNDYPKLAWENTTGGIITKPESVYGGGTGSAEDPYLIYTAMQLYKLSLLECDWQNSFKLMDDIDMGIYINNEFLGIGFSHTPFNANFDGNNKTISNLSITAQGRGYAGMFGAVYGTGNEIKNIILENLNIQTGGSYTGGLIGRLGADDSVIKNCHITSGYVHGGSYTGGLIGFNLYSDNGTISNCSSASEVNGRMLTGGLLGLCSDLLVSQCYASGNVYGTSSQIGGFIGRASNPMWIYDCYAKGDVLGDEKVGGFVGYIWDYYYPVEFHRCFSSGKVTGNEIVGGFSTSDGSIYNSYWNTDTSGLTFSGSGTGLSNSNSKKQSSFNSWDFVGEDSNSQNDIWRMCADGVDYPRLSWELAQNGDFACGDGVDLLDLLSLAEHWLLDESANPAKFSYACDANADGQIDFKDYTALANNWLSD